MKAMDIGTAEIMYAEDGSIESASFSSNMKIEFEQALISQLQPVKNKNVTAIKTNSELVLASFFNTLADIEIDDRGKFHIVSDIKHCDEYPNGDIKRCIMHFSYREIGETVLA